MTKRKPTAVSEAPAPPMANTSIVIAKRELESRKYANVSFNRSTGRWQAWTNCMATKTETRGPYVGQHSTEYLAARAQDRSLLKHRALATKLPIKLNFPESDYASDEKLRNALTDKEFIKLLKREAHACYCKVERTKCMQRFLDEEQARGNLSAPSKATGTSQKVTSLRDFLMEIFLKRETEATPSAPKKHMWKCGMKHRTEIAGMIDELLRDDDDHMTDVEAPQQEHHVEQLDVANLEMLANVALTHPDLKPYEV